MFGNSRLFTNWAISTDGIPSERGMESFDWPTFVAMPSGPLHLPHALIGDRRSPTFSFSCIVGFTRPCFCCTTCHASCGRCFSCPGPKWMLVPCAKRVHATGRVLGEFRCTFTSSIEYPESCSITVLGWSGSPVVWPFWMGSWGKQKVVCGSPWTLQFFLWSTSGLLSTNETEDRFLCVLLPERQRLIAFTFPVLVRMCTHRQYTWCYFVGRFLNVQKKPLQII